jgi:hypothetical protein
MANGELLRRLKTEITAHGNAHRLSIAIGINPGVIYRVLHGGNSPTLRRLWHIPKHPPRPRLIINSCPPELKEAYDAICAAEDVTRAELLAWMVRNHTEFNGTKDYAELPY